MAAKRFELGEPYRRGELGAAGTVVVASATPWGFGAEFATRSPCCHRQARLDATAWYSGTGKFVTCAGCGWKWDVYLAGKDGRLPALSPPAAHPFVPCDRAEWVSRGHGTRPYRRRAAR